MKKSLGLSSFFCPNFPFFHILQNYSRSNWSGDWRASINVALLAIPQGMAYALVAGLPIEYGLLGSAFAAIFGGLFGKGRFITLGPTNATAVLLFGVFAGLGMINRNGMGSESALHILPWILGFSDYFYYSHPFCVFPTWFSSFPEPLSQLRNIRFSDHCQPIQALTWSRRKRGSNIFHLLGYSFQHFFPA